MSINVIGDLWLEVTRRCNMSCSHCCRGDAQYVDMDCMVLFPFLNQVEGVGNLGFTGGEPTLVPDKMLEILQTFKDTNTSVVTLEMVTNGKDITDGFIYAWATWLDYCDTPGSARVFVSGDEYHEKVDITHLEDMLNCSVVLRDLPQVFAEGRKSSDRELPRIEVEDVLIENNCVVSPVYLSCTGDLLSGVDWSYESQERVKICNVFDSNILKSIKEWSN